MERKKKREDLKDTTWTFDVWCARAERIFLEPIRTRIAVRTREKPLDLGHTRMPFAPGFFSVSAVHKSLFIGRFWASAEIRRLVLCLAMVNTFGFGGSTPGAEKLHPRISEMSHSNVLCKARRVFWYCSSTNYFSKRSLGPVG